MRLMVRVSCPVANDAAADTHGHRLFRQCTYYESDAGAHH